MSTTRGFSMVELMVVLAIASILSAMAVPSFADFLAAQRLRLAAHALSEGRAQARLSAISRGETVLVAPEKDDWSTGWSVFVDADGDHRPGPADLVVAHHTAAQGDIAIAMGFSLPDRDGYVAFAPSGRSCRAGAPELPRWGTLTVAGGGHKRRIKVNFGRHRMCNPEVEPVGCDGPDP